MKWPDSFLKPNPTTFDQTSKSFQPQTSRFLLSNSTPNHWHSANGPSNWFEVAHPPGWKSELEDNVLHLTASDDSITLTLHSIWQENDDHRMEDDLKLEQVFPVRRNVEHVEEHRIDGCMLSLRGEAILGEETPWWRRMLSKREWRQWRLWALSSQRLCVIGIFLHDSEMDPESEAIVRLILSTVTFASLQADPPRVFAQKVLTRAEDQFPEGCTLDDKLQLSMGESTINLFNLYRAYVNNPTQFDEIVNPALSTLIRVQAWDTNRLNPSFDDVHDRIMPMLYPRSVWKSQFSEFTAEPWIADLMILFVVDEDDAYWYIRDELLGEWGLDCERLQQVAMSNLDNYFEENSMEFMLTGEEDGPKLLLPHRPDAYNTARILSRRFHASVQEILGREFVVGVPNRDFFVAASLHSDEIVGQIRQKVADDYQRMDHPLSDRLLLVSTDGVSEY
jgi:hypothetical protein